MTETRAKLQVYAALDPQAKAVLDEVASSARPMPRNQDEWLAGYRAQLDAIVAMQGPAPAVAIVERRIAGGGGAIDLRLYRPDGPTPRPTALFVHGGGFVAGSLAGYDIPLRWLALRSGWQIAAVDYRLAPEHPYPAASDDCMAALTHLMASPEVDPSRIAVIGDSAGGCLAAIVASRARTEKRPLALQVLLYPNTDLREVAPYASRTAFDGAIVRLDELYRSLALYCGAADRTRGDVSPVLADDLAGLCPALVVTNEIDPLRDEAEAYAVRLRAAGVPTDFEREAGMIHSAIQRGARIDRGDVLISRIAQRLRAVRH